MIAPRSRELFPPDRLLAFSDGVFGVAITLLVIDVRLPPISEDNGDPALLQALVGMSPRLFVFVFTFLVVGMHWLGHHRKFSYIHKVDGWLLWINLLYLMALCLVPFASSVLSEHSGNRFAFVLYAAVMALADLLSAGVSTYGLREPLLAKALPPRSELRQDMIISPLLVSTIFMIAGGLAFGGLMKGAHWVLLMIVPVMAFFGSRTNKAASVQKS